MPGIFSVINENHRIFLFAKPKIAVRFDRPNTYQISKLVDQLNDSNDLAQRVLNCHAQNGFVFEFLIFVYFWIETRIKIGVRYIHSLFVEERGDGKSIRPLLRR